jgi:predicted protein tyrosine phosphatase
MIDRPLKQTICGLPELPLHCQAGVTHILSILDPETPDAGDFDAYPPHDRLILRFRDIIAPVPGMVAPEREDVEALLKFGRRISADRSHHLLIHCHMGVSRSTAAATALLLQAHPHADETAVLAHLLSIRPQASPNARMIRFADELLRRNGRLVEALHRFYERDPTPAAEG